MYRTRITNAPSPKYNSPPTRKHKTHNQHAWTTPHNRRAKTTVRRVTINQNAFFLPPKPSFPSFEAEAAVSLLLLPHFLLSSFSHGGECCRMISLLLFLVLCGFGHFWFSDVRLPRSEIAPHPSICLSIIRFHASSCCKS